MKLKFYLRGLGIGVVVSVIILAFTMKGNTKELSDEEIRQRALELGMVEQDGGVLADDLGNKEPEVISPPAPESSPE